MTATDATVAPPAPAPTTIKATTVGLAYTGIIVAMAVSLIFNIYHDLHMLKMLAIVALPAGIAPPFLCAILGHLAAESGFSGKGKAWVYGLTAAMMIVSAYATASVINAGTGMAVIGWVIGCIFAFGIDAISMTCLYLLMEAKEREKAYAEWEAQWEAHRAWLASATAGTRKPGTPAAGTRVAGTPASGTPAAGTPVPLHLVPQSAGGDSTRAEAPAAAKPVAAAPPRPAITAGQGRTGKPIEEIWSEARAMRLAADGARVSRSQYMALHGGKPDRVGPVIKFVNDVPAGQLARMSAQELMAAAAEAEAGAPQEAAGQG